MHVLISADLEGVAGVVSSDDTNPGRPDYERGRRLMTAEVNAAITGAFDHPGTSAVTVADSHGPFRNLPPDEVDPRARLVRGKPRQLGMMEGVTDGVGAVAFVGYHGRAGTGRSVLSHTMSDALTDVRCNGRSLGEAGLNAALAGHYGVPVVLVSGDDTVCAELQDLVPAVRTVEVKRSLGQRAADSLHPTVAAEAIRAGMAATLAGAGQVPPYRIAGPVQLEVDLSAGHMADHAELVPGMVRDGGRTVAYAAPDFLAAFRMVRLISLLAGVG